MAVSPGFQSDHVLTGQILLPWADYSEGGRLKFMESLMDKLDQLPGVLSAAWSTMCFQWQHRQKRRHDSGSFRRPGESARGHYSYGVGGDYFRDGFSLRQDGS